VRVYYAVSNPTSTRDEEGTIICWRPLHTNQVKFLVDEPGNPSDLLPGSR
jgi:hypothetical protein